MATTTKTYTKSVKLTGYTTCTVTYTVTESETNATIAFTKIAWTNSRTSGLTTAITWRVQTEQIESNIVPHFPELSETGTAAKGKKSWSKTLTGVSASCAKGHSAVTASNSLLIYMNDSSQSWQKSVSITAPTSARTSYKVTYNANGGSGAPSTQTKWHGETLTLSSVTPSKAGYSFKCWNTNASGTGTNYGKGASYTGNAALNLYAVWEPWITGIALSVNTLRVADSTSTAESDEGTWCYGTCDYTVTGAASGTLTLTVSVSPQDTSKSPPEPDIQTSTFTVDKSAGSDLTGSIVFRASGCSTESSYTFTVDASCANTTTGTTQTAVEESQSDVLSVAYFTMDVLGDKYWDKDTQTGERPGHGIAFGEPAKWEGFRVGMKPYFGEYPAKDTSDDYLLIVGNGTADNARSNALAVTRDGDIETAKDTAWIDLNGTIKYRIHHGVCYVCGDSASGGTSVGTSGTTVGTLPAGARPSIKVTGAASTKSNAANGQYSIDSSGAITVWNLQTSSPYWCFAASYPVG